MKNGIIKITVGFVNEDANCFTLSTDHDEDLLGREACGLRSS